MLTNTSYTDQELLEQLRLGDSSAFDALYAAYWSKVYGQAFKRLQNTEQAKDITQEVFVSLWARKEVNRIDNLAAYFFTAVRNNVFKLQRKEQLFTLVNDLMEELYASPNQADALLLEHDFFSSLGSLIETLPPAQQQIFKMRYQEELSTTNSQKTIAHLQYWKKSGNKPVQKKIQELIMAIQENPYERIGKPEDILSLRGHY